MAWKRHLWYTDLALVSFLRLDDLIISYSMFFQGWPKRG